MRRGRLVWVTMAFMAVGASLAAADEPVRLDALLKLLADKGVITPEQAAAVMAESAAEEHEDAEAPQGVALAASKTELPKALKGLSIGTLAYASYQDNDDASRFTLKRGYVTVKRKITPFLEARITSDTHQDSTGDWKVRMKYLYAKFHWQGGDVISKPYVEFGVAHMPWLDFEEHINRFRMQDTMFMERNGLFNSADAGVMLGANLGKDLPKEYTRTVNDHYAGRWGSFQVGVFNGGGYHAKEKNDNKVLEGRLTIRPLPDQVPGLQVSLFGLNGDGNIEDDGPAGAPEWDVFNTMVSYESRYLVATAQFVKATGNQKGTAVNTSGRALDQDGYSFFAELRCPRHEDLSLIARYDRFDTDTDDPAADLRERQIIGLAWQFARGNYWVLDYDRVEHSVPSMEDDDRLQLTLQLKY